MTCRLWYLKHIAIGKSHNKAVHVLEYFSPDDDYGLQPKHLGEKLEMIHKRTWNS
jgi:hypothetical protein